MRRDKTLKVRDCFIAPLVVLALTAPGWSQAEVCADLHAAKKTTYGFRASELTEEQRQHKSNEMDSFWDLVKEKGGAGITCLKDMLLAETEDGFFVFDGSSLLLALDPSQESVATASQALRYASLAEEDAAGYLKLVLQLSRRGADIGPLAEK